MKLVQSEHVGHITRLPPSKRILSDLAPLYVSVWCTTCDNAMSERKRNFAHCFLFVRMYNMPNVELLWFHIDQKTSCGKPKLMELQMDTLSIKILNVSMFQCLGVYIVVMLQCYDIHYKNVSHLGQVCMVEQCSHFVAQRVSIIKNMVRLDFDVPIT